MKNTVPKVEPHFTLREAVELFFPGGHITLRSLRTEIKKGRLCVTKVAGKFLVSERAIAEMLEKCRCPVEEKPLGSNSVCVDHRAKTFGRSETERLGLARDAANTILNKHIKLSRVTSQKNTAHLVHLPDKLLIDEVMAAYLNEYAQHSVISKRFGLQSIGTTANTDLCQASQK